jgi:hypothetical protein
MKKQSRVWINGSRVFITAFSNASEFQWPTMDNSIAKVELIFLTALSEQNF